MKSLFFLLFLLLSQNLLSGQMVAVEAPNMDSLSKQKKAFIVTTAGLYTSSSIGLYYAWYRNYPQRGFHFFDDWGEWQNIDKLGHSYGTYIQSDLLYQLASSSGYSSSQSINIGLFTALGFQTAIEIMDGFSSGWGFSVFDLAANIVGGGSFYFQQKHWGQQKIRWKMSYWPVNYPETLMLSETWIYSYSLDSRASALYGQGALERFVKDYNGQTIWLSFNLKSLGIGKSLPSWLNLAVGFGAENMYGGFNNHWELNDENIIVPETEYPRKFQFIFSPDIDFSKLPARNTFVRTLFSLLNLYKLPAPSIVLDTTGEIRFTLFFRH